MKVILLHGKNVGPQDKWYPWFAKEMASYGIECHIPALPNSADPVMDDWKNEIDKLRPDYDTILIGHSRGGVAVLRWLEDQPEELSVKKVILVAANSGFLSKMAVPSESNYGFYTEEGYDFDRIRRHCDSFVVLHSKDDKWVPYEQGKENAAGLHAKFLSLEDRGHFGTGVDEVPELLAEVIS